MQVFFTIILSFFRKIVKLILNFTCLLILFNVIYGMLKKGRKKNMKKRQIKYYDDTCGTCYSRVKFPKTKQGKKDAEYISRLVKESDDYANGGWFHGMPMGGMHVWKNYYEVYMNFFNFYTSNKFDVIEDRAGYEKAIGRK